MTYYSGGKRRLGLQIATEMLNLVKEMEDAGQHFEGYCEPFCGMMGVYEHLTGSLDVDTFLAGDRNEAVVKLLNALKRGWKPPRSCSRERFYKLKKKGGSSLETIFLGHAAALRACYLTTFRDDSEGRISRQADTAMRVGKKIKPVKITAGTYDQFSDLKGFVIYCDPPYRNTKHHYFSKGVNRTVFDSDAFEEWCRKMSENNLVILSEFATPQGCTRIWSKGKEKLFAF